MFKKIYKHLELSEFKVIDYILVTILISFNVYMSILISSLDGNVWLKMISISFIFFAFLLIASMFCSSDKKQKNFWSRYVDKTIHLKIWVFLIVTFIITPISSLYFDNVKNTKIVEQQRQIKFKNDSLKIVRDSLQKVYINSSHYADSIKDYNEIVELYKNGNFLYSHMKISNKKYSGNKVVLKYDGVKCGEDYSSCQKYIDKQCKYKTSSTTDLIFGKVNYSEYKICLDMATIEDSYVPYSYDYIDTTYVDKKVKFENVKIEPHYLFSSKAYIKFIDKETNQVIKTCKFGKEKHCTYNYNVNCDKIDCDQYLDDIKTFSSYEKVPQDLIDRVNEYVDLRLITKDDYNNMVDGNVDDRVWNVVDSLKRISSN